MNHRLIFLAVVLMTLFSGLQAQAWVELSESAMLSPDLKEATVHMLSDNFDDSDDLFRFIELASSSYIVITEGGIYSLTSRPEMNIKELYRTNDTIEFLQLLYDNEREIAVVFAHQNMRAGIVSESYVMLQIDRRAGFSATCYLVYTFQHDSENGGNGIDSGEKVASIDLIDGRSDEDPMVAFKVDCCNYADGSKWKEIVVFRKNQNVFQLLTRRKLLR